MTTSAPADDQPDADAAVALVRQWLQLTEGGKPDAGAARLAGLLHDDVGLEFAIGFVDRVARPDDLGVAARNLEQLAQRIPSFLPWPLRVLIAIGGPLARLAPWPIVPIARRVLRVSARNCWRRTSNAAKASLACGVAWVASSNMTQTARKRPGINSRTACSGFRDWQD